MVIPCTFLSPPATGLPSRTQLFFVQVSLETGVNQPSEKIRKARATSSALDNSWIGSAQDTARPGFRALRERSREGDPGDPAAHLGPGQRGDLGGRPQPGPRRARGRMGYEGGVVNFMDRRSAKDS